MTELSRSYIVFALGKVNIHFVHPVFPSFCIDNNSEQVLISIWILGGVVYNLCLFREEDIMFSISVIQWIMEFCQNVLFMTYHYFLFGYSKAIDKLGIILYGFFMAVLQPCFYLMTEQRFRTDVMKHGTLTALWNALVFQ